MTLSDVVGARWSDRPVTNRQSVRPRSPLEPPQNGRACWGRWCGHHTCWAWHPHAPNPQPGGRAEVWRAHGTQGRVGRAGAPGPLAEAPVQVWVAKVPREPGAQGESSPVPGDSQLPDLAAFCPPCATRTQGGAKGPECTGPAGSWGATEAVPTASDASCLDSQCPFNLPRVQEWWLLLPAGAGPSSALTQHIPPHELGEAPFPTLCTDGFSAGLGWAANPSPGTLFLEGLCLAWPRPGWHTGGM